MSEILKISGLWGGYKEGVDILRGIDMTIQEGEAVGIIGLNGSGKSTLGKAIMNMIPIRRGEILFYGEDITAFTPGRLARRGISIMQQGGRVFPNFSVWDNLRLAMADNRSNVNVQWSVLAEFVPLLKHPNKDLQSLMADKLSGGQKHQLSLAMTLATNPRLVILDEPSAGLSPKAVEELYQLLRDVRAKLNVTIILIEQNIAKAVGFCDRIILIRQGVAAQVQPNETIREIGEIMYKMYSYENY